jgi:hypothetical protein
VRQLSREDSTEECVTGRDEVPTSGEMRVEGQTRPIVEGMSVDT